MRWLIILFLFSPQSQAPAPKSAAQILKDAGALYQAGDPTGARRLLELAIEQAVTERDRPVEADARFTLGQALSALGQYEQSNLQLRTTLTISEELGNRGRQADALRFLGGNAFQAGKTPEARANFQKAIALYEAVGNTVAVANGHLDLVFVTEREEQFHHIERGLQLARQTGARKTEAALLHAWADAEYASDDFDAAFDRLNQAQAILEDLNDRVSLANVLTSLGRLYRVHGHPDEALRYYQRARDLHKEAGNLSGFIQSLQAMGTALNYLGRPSEALGNDQEALRLARQSGSPLFIKFALEGVASSQLNLGRYDQAAAVLEEGRQMTPPRFETLMLLSDARFKLGQYEAAWKIADESLAIETSSAEHTRDALEDRAQASWKLGRTPEALRDVRQLMESVEQARTRLVPTDFMRQGFADTDRKATGLAIHILLDGGEAREALETAERARGRAFLDLMAAKKTPGDSATAGEAPPSSPVSVQDALALARRLDSTILAYWVDDSSTIIWTVSPDGHIAQARTAVGAAAIGKWIDSALGTLAQPGTSKTQLASRGGETLVARPGGQDPWRHLYDALIRPVRSNLPARQGSRLTIIPSGPLFRISFGALMDEKGRYLIENYSLHYSPAIDVFQYTLKAQERASASPDRYLLVANPSGMPRADGKLLPALPGSEKEVQSIARLTAPGSAVLLFGKQASEVAVRQAMPTAKVIHLATHGVIDSANPLNSFLALGRTGDEPSANGRLTAAEVYAFDLHADLVVLSACRTGLGKISGDGVAGLARAFLYAGAASVVSTLWDVADQPTAQLLEDFYRTLAKGGKNAKSESLRAAQLRLLRSLRRGEVRVDTPFGKLPLPEDPLLWAGYVLVGEP